MKVALTRHHALPGTLLDEPTNGLDIPSVHALREILRRMRDQGACILSRATCSTRSARCVTTS